MSSYLVPTWDPLQVCKLGWDRAADSYWFVVYKRGSFGETEVSAPEVTFSMGVDEPWRKITNVGELCLLTWGEVDWATPQGVYAARALRDDPIFEAIYNDDIQPPIGVDDFLVHVFDARAIVAEEAQLRTERVTVPAAPAALRSKTPPAAPKPADRVPPSRRRFLRRRNS